MSNLKTLVLMSLVAGLTAPILANDKVDLGDVKNPDEITSSVGEMFDINLQGDEIGNPFIVSSIPYTFDVPDISIFNNVYTSTNYSYLRPGDDVVFKFTPATTSSNNTIDLSASYSFNAVDTYMHVFKNTIDATGFVARDDDAGDGLTSKIVGLTFLAGNDYYIIVETYGETLTSWHVAGSISGPCVDPGCPTGFDLAYETEVCGANTNGTCATAEFISENTGLCGNTKADAGADTDYYTFQLTGTKDVSITVDANCVPMYAYLYSACNTSSLTSVTVAANAIGTSTVVQALPAGSYSVKVLPQVTTGYPCSGNYHYGLRVNTMDPPPPPANNSMAGAYPIALGECVIGNNLYPYTDTTLGYADTTHLACTWKNACSSYYSTTSGAGRDAWYRVELPCDGEYTFEMTEPTTSFDSVIGVFNAAGQLVAGNDDVVSTCDLNDEVSSRVECCLLTAGTYFIAADGFSSSSQGNFELCVSQCNTCPEVGATELPTTYSLKQNVPNPFNPTTTISFSMAETGAASLKVFDLVGREVATLVNGNVERGEHSVSFDASNLSSGVYFYTLQTGASVETKKMVLMK